jgi:two-component system response regulator FixJ
MAKKATKPVTNVFLIIRDRAVRTALAGELKEAGYNAIDYQTAREFLIDKRNYSGGIVMSELRLLGMQGSELVEQLAAERATFPVALIVNNADTPKAVKAGVDFVCGPLSAEILIAAIQRVNTPEEFSERDLQWFFDRLTPAESRVFEGVIAGKASRAIAAEIGISTKTVEAHRARINAKSRATDVGQLIRMWKAWQETQ